MNLIEIDIQYYTSYSIGRKGMIMTFTVQAQVLEFCVLALLEQGDSYGYELTRTMMETFSISESTLYPVLRRLKKDSLLTTYDQPFDGRNRRYYALTNHGRKQLQQWKTDWRTYVKNIESIVGNSQHD